jgi:cytochrome P450
MTVTYNPFEPGYIENPYPALRELREADPVHRSPLDFWMLTRYDDMNTVLRDTERFGVDHRKANRQVMEGIDPEFIPVILFRDPPEHTRLRRLLSRAFTPVTVEQFRPRVRELLDGVLDTMAEKGEFDVVAELAMPLPFLVISELLGMPAADREQVLTWTSDIVNITEPTLAMSMSEAIISSRDEMRGYLADVVAAKRKDPADDIITALSVPGDGGDMLDDAELVDHIMLLHVSAHEPTSNHLAHGILALLRHPDQAVLLRGNPDLDVRATEELLRYEAPLQLTGRLALEEVEIDGHVVEKGSPVVMSLAAANHDPAHWGPTADDLDLLRPRAQDHLSFARGVHTCFGSALARLQGQETFGRVLRRFPDLTLLEEPTWNGRLNGRGPETVRVSTAAA